MPSVFGACHHRAVVLLSFVFAALMIAFVLVCLPRGCFCVVCTIIIACTRSAICVPSRAPWNRVNVFVKCKIAVILGFFFVENLYVTVFGFRTITLIPKKKHGKNVVFRFLKNIEKNIKYRYFVRLLLKISYRKFFYRPILIAAVVLPYTPKEL